MHYNWKCCSFYPNNFGASALPQASVRVSTGQWKHVNRPVDYNWSLRKNGPPPMVEPFGVLPLIFIYKVG